MKTYDDLTIDERREVICGLLETAKMLTIFEKDLTHDNKNESWKFIEKAQDILRADDNKLGKKFDHDLEDFVTNYQFEK